MNWLDFYYQEDQETFSLILIVSLLLTMLAYGIYPLLLARCRRKPITSKRYTLFCFLFNFLVMLIFVVLDGASSGAPYFLWTSVFSFLGKKILSGRNVLIDSDADENETEAPTSDVADPAPAPVSNVELAHAKESAPAPVPVASPSKPKKQKAIFCKYCGQLIDQDTKKCTGCGKQYFRLPKAKKSAVVLWVVILLSVAAIGLCMRQISQYQQQIESLNTQIAQLNTDLETANQSAENWKSRFDQEQSEKYKLQYERIALRQDLDFFNRHVVFVLDDGSREYHKYDCLLFKYRGNAKFWAYNTEAAKSKGYKTCSLCNK